MILGADKILELINRPTDKPLIENITPEQTEGIEGVSVDLRLDQIHQLQEVEVGGFSTMFLGRTERRTPIYRPLPFKEEAPELWELDPRAYYLVQTMEVINTPDWLMPVVYPRTSIFRGGLRLYCSTIAPGYCGVLTFGLDMQSSLGRAFLQRGARIAQVVFQVIAGEAVMYDGQWQHGKMSSQGDCVHAFRR